MYRVSKKRRPFFLNWCNSFICQEFFPSYGRSGMILLYLLLCSHSPNDVFPEPQQKVSIATVRGASFTLRKILLIAVLQQKVTSQSHQNCIYDIIFSSSALLKTQMALSEKILSFRTFSDLHFKETKVKKVWTILAINGIRWSNGL